MAGFFGFGGYNKTGPGIAKNGPKKKRSVLFFERYFGKIWKLMWLNSVYLLFCIPIITIGPATAALTKVIRNFTIEKPTFPMQDFLEAFKKNFKQSFPVGIADVLIIVNLYLAIIMYPQMASQSVVWWILLVATFSIAGMLLMMNFYIYLMIVSTELSLKNILKNSFFLSCLALKTNFLTMFLSILILVFFAFLILINPMFTLFIPFFPLTTISFLICFNAYPIIKKYVIDPFYEAKGEKNPEDAKFEDGEDVLFEDRGGFEKPAGGKEKKKKRKTIS